MHNYCCRCLLPPPLGTLPTFEKYLLCKVTSCLQMLEAHCNKYTSLASLIVHRAYILVFWVQMSCYNIYESASPKKTRQIKVTCRACYFLQWFPKMFFFFLKDAALGLDPRCNCFQCASFCVFRPVLYVCLTLHHTHTHTTEVFPLTHIILTV